MRRTLEILGAYVRRWFLHWFFSRGFAFTLVVQAALGPLTGLAIWTTAVRGVRQVPAYYFALLVTRLCTASYERHIFSERVYLGEFTDDLLRPSPAVLDTIGQNLAIRIWHLVIGMPVIVIVGIVAKVNLDLGGVALALPALVIAACIAFLFMHLLSLSAFWTTRIDYITGVASTLVFLLGGGAAPVPLLPESIQPFVAALPFRAMNGFPAELASGWLSTSDVIGGFAWQLAWMLLLLMANLYVWKAGIRRYTAVGT